MPGKAYKLGPGTLILGETTDTLDMSCQLSAAKVTWDKDKDDDTPTLCGDIVAGGVTYSAKLSGTVLVDLSDGGLADYTWLNKGLAKVFKFVPTSDAGKAVNGTVTVDPIDVGGDEVKKNMTSDFEWDCVGEPTLDAEPPVALRAAREPLAPATREPATVG